MSNKKGAIARLRKELRALMKEPVPYIHVAPNESNFLLWSYLLEGPPDTPYHRGWYWGRIKFPPEYPFRPPAILMVTPSGRFRPDTRLCLSMSDFHPETWNPSWSLATVLTGLLSFMCEDTPTTGAIETTEAQKRAFAAQSLRWNLEQEEFVKLFPDIHDMAAAAAAADATASISHASAGPVPPTGRESAAAAGAGGGGGRTEPEEGICEEQAQLQALRDCRATLETLRADVTAAGDVVTDFVERAEGGRMRVASLRAQRLREIEELTTQLLIKLDGVCNNTPAHPPVLLTERGNYVWGFYQLLSA
eukprot:COSAG01_NODE_6028_length_3891_cov_2.424842_4_plen_306_part_00